MQVIDFEMWEVDKDGAGALREASIWDDQAVELGAGSEVLFLGGAVDQYMEIWLLGEFFSHGELDTRVQIRAQDFKGFRRWINVVVNFERHALNYTRRIFSW
jgi:hypothetical protein